MFYQYESMGVDLSLHQTFELGDAIFSIGFSSDGHYLAAGCLKSTQVFDIGVNAKIATFRVDIVKQGDRNLINDVRFTADSRYLVGACEDKNIYIWDITRKTLEKRLIGHEDEVQCLDISTASDRLASGSRDSTIRVWNITFGTTLQTINLWPEEVTSVAFSPDAKLLAGGTDEGIIHLWDTEAWALVYKLEAHTNTISSVIFSHQGDELVSSSWDNSVRIWRLSDEGGSTTACGICKARLLGHSDKVRDLAKSPDGMWIVSGGSDQTLQFWDAKDGRRVLKIYFDEQVHLDSEANEG